METRNKVLDITEAIDTLLPDEPFVTVGGMHMHNNPMALIREIVKKEKRINLLATSPSGSINADMLIGAGLVDSVLSPYIGLEYLGLAPCYRRKAEKKEIRIWECDSSLTVFGFRAGAEGVPFHPLPQVPGKNEIAESNTEFYREVEDRWTGERVRVVPALRPDIALVHCEVADIFGNCSFGGSMFLDKEMIKASECVLVQVERVLPGGKRLRGADIPGHWVSAIVEARYGCHPTSSHGNYSHDEEHLRAYLEAARTEEGFINYIEKYVKNVDCAEGYIELVGGAGRMKELESMSGEG
jgi:glutaconate CoA-transferase subunit A